jgi:excisionase family DNA binding protein
MSELLTVSETAEKLKVDEETIRRWLQTGKLKGIKISPQAWRVRQSDLDNFLQSLSK